MIRGWRHWSMRSRLVAACVLPACMMFVVTVVFLYRAHTQEMKETMQAHAELMAHALSDSAQYGLTVGDWSYLRQVAHTLLAKTGGSLRKIVVLDPARNPLLERHATLTQNEPCAGLSRAWCAFLIGQGGEHLLHFEVPIESYVVAVSAEEPWRLSATPALMPSRKIGYLAVTISSLEFMARQWRRIGVGAGVALCVLLVSGWLGWLLARSVTAPLAQVMTALRGIQEGRYASRLQVSTGGEIGELQGAVIEMALRLSQFNRELEDKVRLRTRELEQARNEAAHLNEERRLLIQRLHSAVEDERRKIAFALHDHWNAQVIAIRLQASLALKLSKAPATPEAAEPTAEGARAARLAAPLHAIIDATEQLYASGRSLIKQLYPEMIEIVGVVGAIESMVDAYNASHPTCGFLLEVEGELPFSHGEEAITLYRLAQEALSNVVKHAGATRVCVTLGYAHARQQLTVVVADNGCGFVPEQVKGGMGLAGMRERAQAFGGELSIESRPGAGASVRAVLHLPRA